MYIRLSKVIDRTSVLSSPDLTAYCRCLHGDLKVVCAGRFRPGGGGGVGFRVSVHGDLPGMQYV